MEALKQIRVLDLSHLGPGMMCTMILADFGAEVINITSIKQDPAERPKIGEDIWSFEEQINLIHSSFNRNKKSIKIDFKSGESKLFMEMAKSADVIVEDFRPGVTKRLGIDYDSVKKLNPRIIYCSLSGFGQEGPYQHLPGHDINFIGLSGLLDMIGEKNEPPVIPLFFLADFAGAGLQSVIGILIALLARNGTGQGQYLDISFVETAMTLFTPLAHLYLNKNITVKRGETLYSGSTPCYAVYRCGDGKYITIGCFEPWLWSKLCKSLSLEKYIEHQFPQGDQKKEQFNDFQAKFLEKSRDDWFELLISKDVCVGKVLGLDEVFEDAQVKTRNLVQSVNHPIRGPEKHLINTIKLSDTPAVLRSASPVQGEDTEEFVKKYLG